MRFTKCLCDHDIAQSLCVGCANGFWDFFLPGFYGKRGTFIDKSWTHNTGGKQLKFKPSGRKTSVIYFFYRRLFIYLAFLQGSRIYVVINHDNISAVTSENEAWRIKPVRWFTTTACTSTVTQCGSRTCLSILGKKTGIFFFTALKLGKETLKKPARLTWKLLKVSSWKELPLLSGLSLKPHPQKTGIAR